MKIIPGIGSLVTAASRAATGKKLEIFILTTKEQTVTIDGTGKRQISGDRSIERRNDLRVARGGQLKKRGRSWCWWEFKRRETQTNRSWSLLIYSTDVPG
jgi:hypothetical protein